ncbi:hypothetical protein [Sinosporangium siamense]|uniref:Prenyltransferase n=1 Tax=Sinosporangium siamense TaxID=1367973 RepID=A0A919RRT5_9ACTN|nr:hypothetical protein [Sinosporangium siamense]GII97346.1 hypothetical protein Ssi02_75770 [Sinosporangium siamense]
MNTLSRAENYLHLHGRLIDRLRFEAMFAGGSRERVLDLLSVYQNPDGGYGNALEPDLRGSASQPEPVSMAFWILDELGELNIARVRAACDYLLGITAKDGGVPWVLPSARSTPRAFWWEEAPDDPPGNLLITGPIAALLHKHGIAHPWLGPATEFCWSAVADIKETTPYEARAAVTFLNLVPDRERAEAEFARLREAILATVTFDPDAGGDAHFPLDYAPVPLRLPLFEQEVLDRHLDALAASQSDEGGWSANWPMWTPVVEHEWGGYLTMARLKTLKAYGRLDVT